MKSLLWTVSVITLFLTLLFVGVWTFSPSFFQEKRDIVSPIPSYLTLVDNDQVRLLDFWRPLLKTFASEDELEITGKSALVFDLASEKTLYEKDPTLRLPMASLTKIMTAIVALENPKDDDLYKVSDSDLVGEDSMGVTAGEELTLEELLYGLMLPSGNDAAEVLASNFSGGRVAFIQAMSRKARALDLTDTNFTNPSGLQGDGDQYTTASDLLVITKYALENFPTFRKVVSTFSQTLPGTNTHKPFYLENETNLLTSYPGVKGVKTGYTPEAGLCLVTYLEYKDHKIIGILLNSSNRRQEMKEMLDYGLKQLGVTPPRHD
ncbi:MAG: serine hydrolase [bacterium]|nr:serine hydrolase [bacterium]